MRWTIGMPSYNNLAEVFFTVQSLRLHHDLTDCEIVVVDNYGDPALKSFIKNSGGDTVRYHKYTEVQGVSAAKNEIFKVARGEYVLIIDSHILIKPGALDFTPPGDDMIQGPLLKGDFKNYLCEWVPEWRSGMWGKWAPPVPVKDLSKDPFEIWAQGAGFFAVKRESWLGFNPRFRGFGAETGYIQEKYRKAGRKVWCYPNMVWVHQFFNQGRNISYAYLPDKIRNYILAFEELGMSTKPIKEHFGGVMFDTAKMKIDNGTV